MFYLSNYCICTLFIVTLSGTNHDIVAENPKFQICRERLWTRPLRLCNHAPSGLDLLFHSHLQQQNNKAELETWKNKHGLFVSCCGVEQMLTFICLLLWFPDWLSLCFGNITLVVEILHPLSGCYNRSLERTFGSNLSISVFPAWLINDKPCTFCYIIK